MSKDLLFWVLMLFWLLAGIYSGYEADKPYSLRWAGFHLLTFILFVVLGWAQFGPPVR